VPRFAFTLENVSDGKLHHFLVKEKAHGTTVDFSLEDLKINVPKKAEKKLVSDVNKLRKQSGGKKKKNDDDDSDSDSDVQPKKNKFQSDTLYYWYYQPFYTYYADLIVPTVYVPQFIVNLSPYVEIAPWSTAFWG